MRMQVLGESLSPSVKHDGCGDLASQPARIAAEFEQRFGGRGEEHGVELTRVALGKRVELVRQCEDEMVVGHAQQLCAARGEPAFLGQCLALWTVPVPTRVVGDGLMSAGTAGVDVSAEGSGPTARPALRTRCDT